MISSLSYSDPVPMGELPADADPRDNQARLWVGNIDTRITEFNMLRILQKYGELKKLDFLYNKTGPEKGKPRGYCFVTYKCKENADKAKKALNGKVALSKILAIREAHVLQQPKTKEDKETNSLNAKEKIHAIEEKLKNMEQDRDEFSLEKKELPVIVRPKQTQNRRASMCNSGQSSSSSRQLRVPYRRRAIGDDSSLTKNSYSQGGRFKGKI